MPDGPVGAAETMATTSGWGMATRLGAGPAVLAVLTVHALAFGAAVAVGLPGAYAAFVLLSAALAAYRADYGAFGVVTATLAAVLLVVLAVPLLLFAVRQSPSAVLDAMGDPAVQQTLYLAVFGPLLAAAVGVGVGVPLAWLLSRGFPGRPLVESLVDLPLVVPHSVAGLVVLYGFGTGGLLPGLSVRGTLLGMVLALVFVSAPYAVNGAREAFETIDPRLEYAARIHGANRWETFRRVTAPLAARGILTGGVLAWARSVSEFGAVAVVAYSVRFFYPPAGEVVTAQHAPVFVYATFLAEGLEASGAVALLLLVVSVALFLAFRWLTAERSGLVP